MEGKKFQPDLDTGSSKDPSLKSQISKLWPASLLAGNKNILYEFLRWMRCCQAETERVRTVVYRSFFIEEGDTVEGCKYGCGEVRVKCRLEELMCIDGLIIYIETPCLRQKGRNV